jgi:hypothetical protein
MPIYPIFNLQSILTINYDQEFVTNKEVIYTVHLEDITVNIEAKYLLLNVYFWKSLVKRKLPIKKKHLFHNTMLSGKEIQRINNNVYLDIKAAYPDDKEVFYDIVGYSISDMDNMIKKYLGSYQCTLDAFNLAELLLSPGVEELTHVDVSVETIYGPKAVEEKIEKAYKAMLDKLKDPTVPNNVLYPFLKLGLLSERQLPQVIVAAGMRTDVNDTVITKPITRSFMNGIDNPVDWASESLAAKKSVFYNKLGMDDSQYENRSQQLLCNTIRHLYDGDCGSIVYMPYYIHTSNYMHTVGANIVDDDGNRVTLTKETVSSYIGKTIRMRSPITCRYTDGICRACGGALTNYMHPKIVIGIASVIEFMAPTSQLILSNKHFSTTKSSMYSIPFELRDIFITKGNDIFIKDSVKLDQLLIGIPFNCMTKVKDLKHAREDGSINEMVMSRITDIFIANSKTGELIDNPVNMIGQDYVMPYFTTECLLYMKHHPELVSVKDDIWLDISRWDINIPIMRSTVHNDSMMNFVKKIGRTFSTTIKEYTSATAALRDLSNLAYSKVDTNILHLGVVIKANLITSETDFNVPVVTNPDKVIFSNLDNIIPRRSLGSQFAFERLRDFFSSATTFTIPKPEGLFDTYLGSIS